MQWQTMEISDPLQWGRCIVRDRLIVNGERPMNKEQEKVQADRLTAALWSARFWRAAD